MMLNPKTKSRDRLIDRVCSGTEKRFISRLSSLTNKVLFEMHIGSTRLESDLSFRISGEDLFRYTDSYPLETSIFGERFNQFLRLWNTSMSPLSSTRIPAVYLEYDRQSSNDFSISKPCIYMALNPDSLPRNEEQGHPHQRALFSGWRTMHGEEPSESLRQRLKALHEALGTEGHVIHLGVMRARRDQVTRLTLFMPISEVCSFLEKLNYPHSIDSLQRALEDVRPFFLPSLCDRLSLILDLDYPDGAIQPKLGFEILVGSSQERANFIDFLVHRSLCSPEKAEWLLNDEEAMRLHYIKLNFEDGKWSEAKAYFETELSSLQSI